MGSIKRDCVLIKYSTINNLTNLYKSTFLNLKHFNLRNQKFISNFIALPTAVKKHKQIRLDFPDKKRTNIYTIYNNKNNNKIHL